MAGLVLGVVIAVGLVPVIAWQVNAEPGGASRQRWLWPTAAATVPAAGVLTAAVAARVDTGPAWLPFTAFAATAPALAVIDLQARLLPFVITVPLAALTATCFITAAVTDTDDRAALLRCLLAAAVLSGVFLAAGLAAPDDLGLGDIAAIPLIAGLLAWQSWTALVTGIAASLGLAFAVGLVVAIRARSLRSLFPLGPALLAGWTIGVLIG